MELWIRKIVMIRFMLKVLIFIMVVMNIIIMTLWITLIER
nr:MAG TPA: hypothetical protein [Caudoviricetes sp.]